MADDFFIPQATVEKIAEFTPKGERHMTAVQIALPMVGNNVPDQVVFATLRAKYASEPDFMDDEIHGVIRWCKGRHPTPSGFGQKAHNWIPAAANGKPTVTKTPEQMAHWWLNGQDSTPEEIVSISPVGLTGSTHDDAILFFQTLYAPTDMVNIVIAYEIKEDGKAQPSGGGTIYDASTRIRYFTTHRNVPGSDAGAWVRMNPCLPLGAGFKGAPTNEDVTAFRFLLVESDVLPLEAQLALYKRLRLPVGAILLSGGKSAHAWIWVNCADAKGYAVTGGRILSALSRFGVDQSNKNPSRLSRLPGAQRTIGAAGDGIQRLLYLNPSLNKPLTEDDLIRFEESLEAPAIEEKPFRRLMRSAVTRFEDLYQNRGKLGVQVGLGDFDADAGGFKPGQMTTIAAPTNGGKSSMGLNIVNGAVRRGYGVALFTLEMSSDEIVDLLVSMNCEVNRNAFNTGFFKNEDLGKITEASKLLCNFPLWIYDDAALTVEQIGARVRVLNADKLIRLVVVDYVQIVSYPNESVPREQQVAKIARGLRILAKETKLPFIVLSQLSDEGKLRESRVVAHESHNVMFLEIQNDERIVMRVTKGRTIRKKSYTFVYEPVHCRIYPPPPPDPEPPSEI